MLQIEKLKQSGITQILKVNEGTRTSLIPSKYGINLKCIEMEDMPDYDISVKDEIEPCHAFIKQGLAKQPIEGTLVICTAGMSRSATVCISYLMKHFDMTYQQAFEKVKQARRFIKPNDGFVKFLQGYEKQLEEEKKARSSEEPEIDGNTNPDCELCKLEKKTQWFERHSEC